eukprot:scaffold659_cov71-Cylindrotheca_fusiformis.AAC.3
MVNMTAAAPLWDCLPNSEIPKGAGIENVELVEPFQFQFERFLWSIPHCDRIQRLVVGQYGSIADKRAFSIMFLQHGNEQYPDELQAEKVPPTHKAFFGHLIAPETAWPDTPDLLGEFQALDSETELPVEIQEAFKECELLKILGLNEGHEIIGQSCFSGCKSLAEVGIPSTVKVIDEEAFEECELLKSLVLNEGLKRIGRGAFAKCKALEEVGIPSTVKVIDEEAFEECELLKSLVLNEGLKRIGRGAFAKCKALEEVGIPSTVKAIDDEAFKECELLKILGLNEGLKKIGRGSRKTWKIRWKADPMSLFPQFHQRHLETILHLLQHQPRFSTSLLLRPSELDKLLGAGQPPCLLRCLLRGRCLHLVAPAASTHATPRAVTTADVVTPSPYLPPVDAAEEQQLERPRDGPPEFQVLEDMDRWTDGRICWRIC